MKSTSCLATESLENKLTKFLYGCGIPFNVVRSSNYEEMIDVDITYGLWYNLLNLSKHYKISFFLNAHKQSN